MSTLKKRAIHSFFWSFVERFGQQGIQFVFSLFLARLLDPEDFGLVGMLVIFMTFGQVLVDCGFGQSLVQKKELTIEDTSTVFWFNLAIGILMTVLIYMAAPAIAGFYHQPRLAPLTRVLSFQLLIVSIGVVQQSLLQRDLLFNIRAIVTFVAVILSSIAGIILAMKGFGVWSLVWLKMVYVLVMTAGVLIAHPWKPKFIFSIQSFKRLLSFSSKLFTAAVIDNIFINLTAVLIGKFYTPAMLGFYSRAQSLVKISSNSLTSVFGQVNFPLLARITDDPAQMVRVFSKILVASVVVIAPVMFGMMAASSELVEVLLGPKWMPCVPYLIPACLIGLMFPIQYLNQNVMMALGRADIFLRLEMIKKTVIVLFLVFTVPFGVLAMVWGQVAASVIGLVVMSSYVGRFLEYGLIRQLRDLIGVLLVCGIMGLVVYFVSIPNASLLVKFLTQIAVGMGSYTLLLFLFSAVSKRSVCGGLVSEGLSQLGSVLSGRQG